MMSVSKVATPATAATVVLPESVLPRGWFASATATFRVKPVAMLPCASSAVTCTGGVSVSPAVALLGGCTVNTNALAAPGVMSNAPLVASVSSPALATSVYPLPTLSMLNESNVATPATAATRAAPDSVSPPGLAPSATVTLSVKPGTVLPNASCAATRTAGLITAPATASLGSTANTNPTAGPAVIENAWLRTVSNPLALAANR